IELTMDSTHCNERPVSYGSTSSSASSRDSHCSLGGRPVLGSAPERDHDSGAIRLELVPAQQLEEEETGRQTPTPTNQSHADIQSPEGRKVQYVDRVVEEILETEKTYVQDLRSIVQDYLESISNQSLLLLGDEERNSLFGNIREIYRFNRLVLVTETSLERNVTVTNPNFLIVFQSEDFHIYTQYCTNYPRSVAVLTECMRNKTVAKFLRERQESLKHSLPLGSYLLKPVQRILKYHLLLHEIATHLEKDSEMYDVIQEAIDTMQRVAWHINDMKRKHEHAVRLQEIQSLLTNWKGPDLIGYGELVLEGTFRIQRAKNERTLFLFDKLLLITKKREETYTYKAHILCCNLMLVEVIPKEPLSFSVFHYKNPKLQHTVQAKSQQDKRMWVLHLKRLILENHPAKIPAKISDTILNLFSDHPSFNYNSDDKRVNTKEGPSPRRVRRKTGETDSKYNKQTNNFSLIIYLLILFVSLPVITPPILRVTAPPEGDRDERYSNMLGTGEEPSFRNIWTDHRVRRAMFPTRQKSFQIDDDEDIYQMFLPTENDMSSHDAESDHETADHPERPCSWHVEQTKPSRLDLPTSRSRILRRASSVGENQSEQQSPTKRALQDEEANNQTESSSNEISGSSSAEQLTIDDIENVYDNISYEELQAMGLIRKDQVNHVDSEVAEVKSRIAPQVIITPTETESSCESNRSSGQGGEPLETCELQIVEDEENVYDTIVFQEPPVLAAEMDQGKPESLKTSEVDIMASQILGGFVSEEKLCPTNKTEDEQPRIPSAAVSDTESSQISTADHTLEQVNEIWTDLENYIRNNEKKPDRLPAAFPVSRTDAACKTQDSPKKVHDTPHKAQDSLQKTHNSPSKGNRLQQRASDSKCKAQESPSKKANSAQNTNDSLCKLPLKMAPVVCAASGSPNPPLGERGKNRVFLMARQYSQKIKKTNQLLKMKSMDHESSCAKLRLSKQKDLAAILEEKKQGGAAIGARIAEYSHLYEQVVFKGSPSTTPMLKSSISISSTQESDWLNCTYSNGELADYVSWPAETTVCTSTPQRGLAPASSTPALKNLPPTPSTPPNQRWSACVTPIKDDSDHIYTSIGPRNAKVSPHNRCQSSSSLIDQTRIENGRGPSNQVWEVKGHESRTHMPRQRSLPDCPVQGTSDLSAPCDITLRDSQQILVLNKNVPLNAQSATENYLANFKDTGDDDDDYVEIRSEDEGEEQKQETAQPHSLTGTTVKYCNPPQSSMQTLIKGQQVSTNPEMALQGYLWNDPDSSQQGVNQPTIVQSLREKFQCLSSSSFA
uniref:Pleckstrin homology and RhoGEF domain containing G1 n=1 Tax=Sinocyclocheilus anshuiensis TaxID=1608454 RepID=A0A671N0S9_9TELE